MGELREAGCLFLSLTGGEVLSHPDLFRFLDRARELNLAVQLLTNGTLLRPGMAKRLASYSNLMGVSVSLYGATADVHDGITQVRGSFRANLGGDREAARRRRGGPAEVHTHATECARDPGDDGQRHLPRFPLSR